MMVSSVDLFEESGNTSDYSTTNISPKAEVLPASLCGLDPLFHIFNKMYIHDILNMPPYSTLPGAFAYKNHPIFRVDILGVVVKVDKKSKKNEYGVDDGTGVIICCIWNENNFCHPISEISKLPDYLPTSLGSKVQQIEEAMHMDFALGDLIHVRGKLTQFHQIRQVTVTFAVCVRDSTEEINRMIELPRLYKNIYNKPFQIPSEVNHETEIDEEAIKKDLVKNLTVFLKHYLSESQKKSFDCKLILQDKNLQSALLEISGNQQKFSDPQELLEIALEAMEKTGEIYRHKKQKNTFESLLLPDSEMSIFILNFLQKQKQENQYLSNGCHIMKVFSEVKKVKRYEDVCKTNIQHCLDLLETNSDIIRITDSHYIAC